METSIKRLSPILICLLASMIAFLFNSIYCTHVHAANLIENGDFVLEASNWHAKYWYKSKIDYLTTEDISIHTEKIGDNYQLVIPVNQPSQSVRIFSDPFPIQDNWAFSFSMDIKLTGTPRSVLVSLANDKIVISKNFNISTDWNSISFSGTIPAMNADMCRIEIKTSGEQGTIYLSSVKLEQPQPVQTKEKFIYLNLQANKALSMFEVGNAVSFTVRSSAPAKANVPVNWTLTDIYGNEVKSGQFRLNGNIETNKLTLGYLGLGWYSLQYVINQSGYKAVNSRVAFSVIPKMSDRPSITPDKSFFGVHTEITKDGLLAAKLMGFKWIRLNAPLITKWNAVEESQGKLTFNDSAVSFARLEGFSILGSLDRTAAWASTGKDDPKTRSSNFYGAYSYLPADWTLWDKYVTSVVSHYQNDIKYWQIWNEPDIQFLIPPQGMDNASAYNQLVSRTAPLIRKSNPNAMLLGGVAYLRQHYPGPDRQSDFLERMVKLGTIDFLDIFTFHHYVHKNESMDQNLSELAFAKTLLNDKSLKYWITEFGFVCSKSNKYDFENRDSKCMDLIDISKIVVKYNVMNLSKGVSRIFFYNAFFDTNGFPDFKNDSNIMWDSKEPRPIVSVYSIMTWLLDGAKFISSTSKGPIQIYKFVNGIKSINVVWSTSNAPQTYISDDIVKFISIDGSNSTIGKTFQVTDEPVYIIYGG